MPPWKQLLLHLYYAGSYPLRSLRRRAAQLEGRLPIVVIYYHRVADDAATPWTVSNRTFARQIRWLRDHFHLISLDEVCRLVAAGENHRPSVCITFDDGYAENCHRAIPLLVKERIPCTYFVTTRNVLEQVPFPHDVARGLECPPNTIEQLRVMAEGGIEIGGHTYTHADLGKLTDAAQLRYELTAARVDLEDALDRPVRHFAFPYGQHGNLSRQSFRAAREAGYTCVCSAYGGVNFPGGDPFHIQRVPVDRWSIRLKNYVTLDPRKVCVPRFEYDTPVSDAGRPAAAGVE